MASKGQELVSPGLTLRIVELEPELLVMDGETFEVPPGAAHQMAPEGGPLRTRWEARPALRAADFFEALLTGKAGENFLTEFAAEVRFG
jgi:hypothetical protein